MTVSLLIVGIWSAIKRSINGIKTFISIYLMAIIIELLFAFTDRYQIKF
jgi:hypothetical protein